MSGEGVNKTLKHYFVPESSGKIICCGIIDGDTLPPGAIETTGEMVAALSLAYGFARWDGEEFSFPKDDRRLWKALMAQGGHTGKGALDAVRNLGGIKEAFLLDTPDYVDISGGVNFHAYEDFPSYDFPEVSGLQVRTFDSNRDFDPVMEASIKAGVHTESEWAEVARRVHFINSVDIIHTWRGRPVQLELYTVEHFVASATRTIHFSKARPYWFWRELMKPVFSFFSASGIEKIVSTVVTERADWIEALKRNFNPKALLKKHNVWQVVYPLDPAIFKGWPDRKTLGDGWNLDSGGVLVREMQEAEIPEIKKFIVSAWGNNPRKELPLEMLEEWYYLDHGTILGGFLNGNLVWVRTARHRREGVASVANYMPKNEMDPKVMLKVHAKMLDWTRLNGYSKITFFIEKKLRDRNLAHYDSLGSKLVAIHNEYKVPMCECEIAL